MQKYIGEMKKMINKQFTKQKKMRERRKKNTKRTRIRCGQNSMWNSNKIERTEEKVRENGNNVVCLCVLRARKR